MFLSTIIIKIMISLNQMLPLRFAHDFPIPILFYIYILGCRMMVSKRKSNKICINLIWKWLLQHHQYSCVWLCAYLNKWVALFQTRRRFSVFWINMRIYFSDYRFWAFTSLSTVSTFILHIYIFIRNSLDVRVHQIKTEFMWKRKSLS